MVKDRVPISIVIPVFNRAGTVTDTLDSVIAQSWRFFRLVIVDNGSTDGTPLVLERWTAANAGKEVDIKLASCAQRGASAARNAGLELVDTQWVMFFDSDDLMLPGHMQLVADSIATNPDADIIGWDVDRVMLDGRRRRCRFFGRAMQRHNLFDGAMATQRWIARTDFVRSVGGWDSAVGYWDDIELGSRMLAANPRIRYIGAGEVLVRESRESISTAGAGDPHSIEAALVRMEKTIGPKGRRWCRLKRAIEYALSTRAGLPQGLSLMKKMNPSPRLWLAYGYTCAGGRGIARLLHF